MYLIEGEFLLELEFKIWVQKYECAAQKQFLAARVPDIKEKITEREYYALKN